MFPYRATLSDAPRSWLDAWCLAAYGEGGFWQVNSPDAHFRTAASTSPLLAQMINTLLAERPEVTAVIDLGAGDGHLLRRLQLLQPRLQYAGVDLRPRPQGLPTRIDWHQDCWDVPERRWNGPGLQALLGDLDGPALVIGSEWLDDLPCELLVGPPPWRVVTVDERGNESIGALPSAEEQQWAERWWPEGFRVEVGATRDAAWASVLKDLASRGGGYALMIDYGHLRDSRPSDRTLVGYHEGEIVDPEPTAQMNLTAHVAVDAIAAAGKESGASIEFMITQRQAVERFLPPSGVQRDALSRLIAASEKATLSESFGDQWWLLHKIGL